MKAKTILIAMILTSLIVMGGCSRPVDDTMEEEDDLTVQVEEETELPQDKEESESENPENESDEEQEDKEKEDKEEEKEDPTDKEDGDENEKEDTPTQSDIPKGQQGCYKFFDSGFEVTVSEPFTVYYDALASNMTVTSKTDPSCKGYIFYDNSGLGMGQLEDEIKNLEPSLENDSTITDLKKEVDKQDDGLFSFTFTYSAGESEGSPAGYYVIHYQKTENGLISANFFTERSSETDAILRLVKSIQKETENAVEYQDK